MLEMSLFEKVINQASGYLTWLHIYFQGEPFLHPRFLRMVNYAARHGIFTSTSTNGHYLTEKNITEILHSGLRQLIVSVDGVSQEIYEKYRLGGNLEKVKNGLNLLIQERKKLGKTFPRIVLQFLVTGQNEHEIPAIKALGKEMGVDELQLKTAQIYNFEKGSELIPSNFGYSRYLPDGKGKWRLKKVMENKCWRMWQGGVVTWDGSMVPCCFDKDAQHLMGNLQAETLDKIWRSEAYQEFRTQLLHDRKEIEICRNCTE